VKIDEIRNLSSEELGAKVKDLSLELFNLKFRLHTGHLENSARIAAVRKDIARVKTALREKKAEV